MSTPQEHPPGGFDLSGPATADVECTFCGTRLSAATKADLTIALLDHRCHERDLAEWISKSLPMKEQMMQTLARRGGWRRIEHDEEPTR